MVALVVEVQIPFFLSALERSRKEFEGAMSGPTPELPIQDMFALYRRTKTLFDMDKAFCPKCAFPCSGWCCRDLTMIQW